MKKIAFYSMVFILFNSYWAHAVTLKCPKIKNKLSFSRLNLFDGDPKQNADLSPDNENSPPPAHWTIDKSIHPWLVCKYGPKDEILFSKGIKGQLASCDTEESFKGSGKYDEVTCQ